MSRIVILSGDEALRGQLIEQLSRTHEVFAGEPADAATAPFDLGILDFPTLTRAEERVRARRRAEDPIFLPFLLVASRSDLRRMGVSLAAVVDDVIQAPCIEVVLLAQVEGLLRTRRMAAELAERAHAERQLQEWVGRILLRHDAERRHIARDLHDTTAQDLAALAMNLSLIEQLVPPQDSRIARILVDCQRLTHQSIKQIRGLSHALYPPLVDELGLIRAIAALTEDFSERTATLVRLDLPEDMERLPHQTEALVLQTLQQALANVHQHSGSPVVHVRLTRDAETVRLEIRDEGCGMPAELTDCHSFTGLNLWELRQRFHSCGGRLEIEPCLPGTRLHAILPLHSREP